MQANVFLYYPHAYDVTASILNYKSPLGVHLIPCLFFFVPALVSATVGTISLICCPFNFETILLILCLPFFFNCRVSSLYHCYLTQLIMHYCAKALLSKFETYVARRSESEPPVCTKCWARHWPNEQCYW
ncbi:uncharacterized protein VTP21DRAFT_1796 [Calcarisporiella thermophila]|uniref:uncharacterized protein n=1 Tax=Calcarisporiella thermophila TaxID=911321 RepID=UPI0037439AF5